MKKTAVILVALFLILLALGASAEELKGIWRCDEVKEDFVFLDNFPGAGMRVNFKDDAQAEVFVWESCDGGVIIDGETYLWTEDGDLTREKTGQVYKKLDFSLDEPAVQRTDDFNEFVGDWEFIAWAESVMHVSLPREYVSVMNVKVHIEEKESEFAVTFDTKQGSHTNIYPLRNPRIEEGVLVMDSWESGEKRTIKMARYENGWLKSPFVLPQAYEMYLAKTAVPDPETAVTTEETAAGQETEDQEPAGQHIMHTAKGGLEVKASASRSAKKVVTLKKDREVTVLGMEGDWYYIEVDLGNKKVQGYVPADALK